MDESSKTQALLQTCLSISQLLIGQDEQGQPYRNIKLFIDQGDGAALLCRGCGDIPDDPVLIECGHIYCLECFEKSPSCEMPGCYVNCLHPRDIAGDTYDALRQILEPLLAAHTPHFDLNPNADLVEPENATPKARKKFGCTPHQIATQNAAGEESTVDSDDDGWEHQSQRSVSYRDDGNSFVASSASSIGGESDMDIEVIVQPAMSQEERDTLIDLEEVGDEEQVRGELSQEIANLD